MVLKMVRTVVLVLVGAALIGGLFFGRDLVSYVHSSALSVQSAVKDSVPIEFELKRARDTLDDVIPEMHANIKMISQEEVEIGALKTDIERSKASQTKEEKAIMVLRTALGKDRPMYRFADQTYSHAQVKDDLSARFERYKEAEVVLASKQHLLVNRQKALQAAEQMLEKTRSQKRLLEDKISALEGQYRLVKAAATGSNLHLDNSRIAQTEKIINEIKKRLDVAQHVMAHESHFVDTIPVETVPEKNLLDQIDEHFKDQASSSADPNAGTDGNLPNQMVLNTGPLASVQ